MIVLGWIPSPVKAEEEKTPRTVTQASIQGDFSALKHTTSEKIDKIIDARTILLKDGTIVRLCALALPAQIPPPAHPEDYESAAKRGLESILPEGTDVLLYQTIVKKSGQKLGRENRMGHQLAHLVRKSDGLWINGALVTAGLAYVMTDKSNPEMATQLYRLEEDALSKKRGFWPVWSILDVENASEGVGNYRIVEGVITTAASVGNKIYLNFGTDYRTDFTVMLSPTLRKVLLREGIDPMALQNQRVRVRGWLREWNGPYMELETKEHLEKLKN